MVLEATIALITALLTGSAGWIFRLKKDLKAADLANKSAYLANEKSEDAVFKDRIEFLIGYTKQLEESSVYSKTILERIDRLTKDVDLALIDIQKLGLMTLIQHNPDRADLIEPALVKYQKNGGNGYVKALYDEWVLSHKTNKE